MIIYIEHVKFYHYFIIHYYLNRNIPIYVFDFDYKVRDKRWLRNLIDRGQVTKIAHYVDRNHDYALDHIEKIYSFYFSRSKLANEIERIYEDQDIRLAYKKILVEDLSNFFAVRIILAEAEKSKKGEKKIVLLPDRFCYFSGLFMKSGINLAHIKNLISPPWAKKLNVWDHFFRKSMSFIKYIVLNFALLGISFFKWFLGAIKQQTRTFQYAIAIVNAGFQFKFNKKRSFDFWLDHQSITKNNTLFVLLSRLSKEQRKKKETQGYQFIDCCYRSVFMSETFRFSPQKGKKVLMNLIRNTCRSLWYSLFEHDRVIYGSSVMLMEYVRWELVLDNYQFRHFIIFNDENIRHIGRNILLRKNNCLTWSYAHSASLGYFRAQKPQDMKDYRHWLWAYLLYDYYLGWNEQLIQYYKMHHQKIRQYINTGCLWSSFIQTNGHWKREEATNAFFKNKISEKELGHEYRTVAVFDSSYMDGISSQYPLKNGIKFYQDMLKLLEDHPNYLLIIKEKKPESWYSTKRSFVYSPAHQEYSNILNVLRNHARAFLTGPQGDPSEVMDSAELIITYAFSSSTIEALGARKKAIFYDPTGDLVGTYYDLIPDLVAHNYIELKNRVHHLFFEVSQEQFDHYLENNIKGSIEDFLDGRALNRIREILVKS